jgi:hypothetical protein
MEKKIGLIPKVIIQRAIGPQEYALLLTDMRSIFILEKKSYATVNYLLGGVAGMMAGSLLTPRKTSDYSHIDVEQITQNKENISILHSQIQHIQIKKSLGSPYTLFLEYTDTETLKNKKIRMYLIPPEELLVLKKNEGMKEKTILQDYVQKAQEALKQSLPQSVLLNVRWAA